jgi:hydrogenase/urease accessory protein HupE
MTLALDIRHRLGDFRLDARFETGRGLVALFGRSGSGKTTLVNIIAGLIRPAEGRVAIDDAVLVDTNRGVFVPRHKRRIGYVFQEGRLFPHLTVRQNLMYGGWFALRGARRGDEFDKVVRVNLLDGRKWTAIAHPSQPWVDIAASQTWVGVATTYVVQGIRHILLGADHMLFVLGLLLLVSDRRVLLKTVTAFTVAHSMTLAIATLGYAEVPVLPLNAAIALSILFLGSEIVRSWDGERSLTLRYPWMVAFAFGLLHGFGFASALTGAGLPGSDLPLALLSFNVGVELGQLGFIALVLALDNSFHVLEVRWPRAVQALPGYTVGSLGAFWTVQRLVLLLAAR